MTSPTFTLWGVVLGAPDARVLAGFYQRLLGWPIEQDEPDWVKLRSPAVDDMEAAGDQAIAVGAVLAGYQPADDVRVYFDPAGHPFCLFRPG